jgi:hypothetical protein
MRRGSFLIAVCACTACSGAAPAAAAAIDCASPPMATPQQVDQALSERSIEILRAAQRSDTAELATAVAPSAEFIFVQRDVMMPARRGTEGALDFARLLHPKDFHFAVIETGPSLGALCGKNEVTVEFPQPDRQHSYVVKFSFDRGLLIRALGKLARLSNGSMEQSGD